MHYTRVIKRNYPSGVHEFVRHVEGDGATATVTSAPIRVRIDHRRSHLLQTVTVAASARLSAYCCVSLPTY